MDLPILSIVTFLPIVAAVFLLVCKFQNQRHYFTYGLFFSFINFILSCVLVSAFDKTGKIFQFLEIKRIFTSYDIKYIMGIDGISLLMIILTAFLVPICLFISINSIEKRVKEYVIAFLLIEGLVIGSFCALDLILFYIFFEAILIPMFLLIGVWGGVNRI